MASTADSGAAGASTSTHGIPRGPCGDEGMDVSDPYANRMSTLPDRDSNFHNGSARSAALHDTEAETGWEKVLSLLRRLCDELDSIIGCQRASGLSTERKVLCALRFFGTGSFRRSVGREEQIGMAQPAASNTIQEVTEAIISVSARRKLVDFSLTPAAKDEAKAAFARRGAIPGVLACVDGTLIAVMKPEGLSPADTASFMSRKGYYALNVIVVCNSELCILVVDLRLPDSGHDSWMWQHNPLCTRLAAQLQPGESLLGKYS
ncbi:hypothetical protein HPB49_012707 [Dermacentor silvarum]|uniref:Uncharacterized protein n=1 Tax=Dermacentor silvarum TaxID=543639 RepID=A0ACB8C978_DERSI|nr:hypothetical protein HPB49_012707 [Dermacentor silvarum]